jgi:hypothetical protein
VENLSLRNNKIDDISAEYISYGIGDVKRQNKKLINLNLSGNLIGDHGAISLARSLRTNRSLLILNLSNNQIGDPGAKAFADVISRFPLTLEEITHRRYIISGRVFDKSVSYSFFKIKPGKV